MYGMLKIMEKREGRIPSDSKPVSSPRPACRSSRLRGWGKVFAHTNQQAQVPFDFETPIDEG